LPRKRPQTDAPDRTTARGLRNRRTFSDTSLRRPPEHSGLVWPRLSHYTHIPAIGPVPVQYPCGYRASTRAGTGPVPAWIPDQLSCGSRVKPWSGCGIAVLPRTARTRSRGLWLALGIYARNRKRETGPADCAGYALSVVQSAYISRTSAPPFTANPAEAAAYPESGP
jgi:hypothetical protein